jgi:ATP-dependent RNA helicase RhlE
MIQFSDLGLAENLLRAVREEGYQTPTPIQAQAIGPIREGRDVLGCAQTGTGKTAAFALPLLDRLAQTPSQVNGRGRKIRVLVLAPTRELTSQIGASFNTYGRHLQHRCALVYGGVSQNPQVRALNQGVDILVATPGRLLDLMNQGFVDLSRVESLVLDEADQMLDMGFIPDLRRIVAKVPASRQTLLFSATMPPEIRQLVASWLRNPVTVQVAPVSAPAERISQSVYHVEQRHKSHLLVHWLKQTRSTRTLVFTRTKHGADKVVRHLAKSSIRAEAIHGNKSQSARERALRLFKSQHPPVLVATDIASRGLDIDDVSHVVNFDLPLTAEAYVHRIGRTARAGASGEAVSFCDRSERSQLKAIERLVRQALRIENDQPQYPTRPEPVIGPPEPAEARGPKQAGSKQGGPKHPKHSGSEQRGAQGKRRSQSKGSDQPRRRRRARNRADVHRV